MKQLLFALVFVLFGTLTPAHAQVGKLQPENLTLTLAMIADAGRPIQYVFVINGVVAYRTLDGLENHLKNLPKGSSLTWAPGCCRIGQEPLINSQEEMKKFKEFCAGIGIKLVIVPSG